MEIAYIFSSLRKIPARMHEYLCDGVTPSRLLDPFCRSVHRRWKITNDGLKNGINKMNTINPTSRMLLLVASFAMLLSGCATGPSECFMEDYEIFVDTIRDYAMEPESPDGIIHSHTATVEERKSEYKVVFVNAQYASYWCDDWAYTGGAHGNTVVHVGTLDRKTGKKLLLDDVFPKECQKSLKKELEQKASKTLAAKGQQLFPHKTRDRLLTDNFCLMEDGWHFVYSPYEIAPFAAGVIEVIIPRK